MESQLPGEVLERNAVPGVLDGHGHDRSAGEERRQIDPGERVRIVGEEHQRTDRAIRHPQRQRQHRRVAVSDQHVARRLAVQVVT